MFSGVRRRFTFVNVAMTVALVFAMSGGAFAAGKFLITSTKQISPKVLKQLKGTNGKNGANGANGVAGVAGAQGPAGPAGATGGKGETGPQGVQGVQGPTGANGKNGTNGKEGSPWTASGTLPPEKTETGAWGYASPAQFRCVADGGKGEWEDSSCLTHAAVAGKGNFEQEPIEHLSSVVATPISFTIPLAETTDKGSGYALGETNVHYLAQGETSTECPGNVEEPKAVAGNLCVYEKESSNVTRGVIVPPSAPFFGGLPTSEKAGAGASGAEVMLEAEAGPGGIIVYGSWAVMAPAEA